ncbi:MAG: ATP-dependent helicase [Dehalococcoidia bacterium]|nr:ATP-dependent helicase [Dehalococcoidia bacterium]
MASVEDLILGQLTARQADAASSPARRLLVVAGAGSGKTEVMARRIAWWIAVEGVEKDRIVAFTFTERAAEEMKFRIRGWLARISTDGVESSLGGMYVGTIHGFCLARLREYWPDDYHNFDILDEGSRVALLLRGFHGVLALGALRDATSLGQYRTMQFFTQGYDQLHERGEFEIDLPNGEAPYQLGEVEHAWCRQARLLTDVGDSEVAECFARSAARYYAYLKCRRFLDFSTSQSEFVRRLRADQVRLDLLGADGGVRIVVDEVQDINPVQRKIVELLVGDSGRLTAVGDHRQSIYGFRGARVEIIGDLWEEFKEADDADVVDLQENFRSTRRVVTVANEWADTIGPVRSMVTEPMIHGNSTRTDHHRSHVALVDFMSREDEAGWIGKAIAALVPSEVEGVRHDKRDGTHRGLTLSDVAVLVRSSTDVRAYMEALEAAGIPCVVRAGPDLFSQPEVLLLLAALAITANCSVFMGASHDSRSLPNRIRTVLGCSPEPEAVLHAAARSVRATGLSFDPEVEARLLFAARAIGSRISSGQTLSEDDACAITTRSLREFATSRRELRRVFPQHIYHMLLGEAGVGLWDTCEGRGQSALFHLGALSKLVTGIETPGWTSAAEYHWQVVGLCLYGAGSGRTEEQPLMVQPDAVSIMTIHAAKGLEFAAVFLADVNPRRFPSAYSRRTPDVPFASAASRRLDVTGLADNDNYDGERRLMYVALTRSERFLFVTHSGHSTSRFVGELRNIIDGAGGLVTDDSDQLLAELRYAPKEHLRDTRLCTSFSDLRYFLECPHDFYLRKVLGFSPTIDQAFGYGRGVHNLLRAIHTDPRKWAALASDRSLLEGEVRRLVSQGLFYLRYTTGEPATLMREKGVRIVADYVMRHADELSTLEFEPEKEFETLVDCGEAIGGVLVSGAIDVVRLDDPPRVALIDFKSGEPDSDLHMKLDENEMQLQVALYAIGAKRELEYQPEAGLVRYLDAGNAASGEMSVPLNASSLQNAENIVAETAHRIWNRDFKCGPSGPPRTRSNGSRCVECDFRGFCGMDAVREQ